MEIVSKQLPTRASLRAWTTLEMMGDDHESSSQWHTRSAQKNRNLPDPSLSAPACSRPYSPVRQQAGSYDVVYALPSSGRAGSANDVITIGHGGRSENHFRQRRTGLSVSTPRLPAVSMNA